MPDPANRNCLSLMLLLCSGAIIAPPAAAVEPSPGLRAVPSGHAPGLVLSSPWPQPPEQPARGDSENSAQSGSDAGGSSSEKSVEPGDDDGEDEQSSGDEQDDSQQNDSEDSLKSLTERIKKLEEQAAEEQKKQDEEAKKPSWELGGRIHLDYWDFLDESPGVPYLEHDDPSQSDFGTDPEDRWAFRRIRLELEGELPANMLFRTQIDFNRPGEPEYKDVYLGWDKLPNNQYLLLGNQKRPIGLDHLNSSRFNVFAERPMVVEAFNEDARRIGLCMYGFNDAETLNWSYGIFSLENTSTSGRLIGDSLQMGGYGRLSMMPWYDATSNGRGYQHLGLAASVARPDGDASAADTNENEARFRTRPEARSDARWLDTGPIAGAEWFEQVGIESITNIGSLQITGEYLATFLQRSAAPGRSEDLTFHGGYIYASYFLTGEFIPYDPQTGMLDRVEPLENFFLVERCRGGRGHGWGAWQVAARYSALDLSDGDVRGGVGHNVTLGLNWHWTAYSRMQSCLVLGTIDSREPVFDPTLGETFAGGDYAIFGSRFMIDF